MERETTLNGLVSIQYFYFLLIIQNHLFNNQISIFFPDFQRPSKNNQKTHSSKMTASHILAIFQPFFNADDEDVKMFGTPQFPIPSFEENVIIDICHQARDILTVLPIISEISSGDAMIVGDIHGNLRDLCRIIREYQKTNPRYLVFLGDYVDRGEFSIEVILIVFSLFIQNPDRVILLRGNHEFRTVNQSYGFLNELEQKYRKEGLPQLSPNYSINQIPSCQSISSINQVTQNMAPINRMPIPSIGSEKIVKNLKFANPNSIVRNPAGGIASSMSLSGPQLLKTQFALAPNNYKITNKFESNNIWETVNEVFDWMQLCCIINGREFCCHGGISTKDAGVMLCEKIRSFSRPIHAFDDEFLHGLVWADPGEEVAGVLESKRGNICFSKSSILTFLNNNRFARLIRGHELVQGGIQFFANEKVVTVFSSGNYKGNNEAGFIVIANNGHIDRYRLPFIMQMHRRETMFAPQLCQSRSSSQFSKLSRVRVKSSAHFDLNQAMPMSFKLQTIKPVKSMKRLNMTFVDVNSRGEGQ
ncbi:hypothetical protein TRFO_20542 [Tritrichomonas foetus]|uniref:Serine/threonine-protein phosphatase n=1 Tax=Tritrichomonas foetus TaxID=1144522 RepID=A0A1J4KKL5_9EUKA|nr:hypothetical protein TRFO_20542 [Tritrichomonas foetus]|eukprot:OHT10238.1 hypothetical protein TRFO_20542 [Tritrichomonas foetus]